MENETFAPLVSIVIPVYNGSNYMREAIDSALAQTYKNIEIIVVNDGSTDNGETERIAKEYGDKIRYICKENGGVSTALNTGIQNMQGEYFSWLSHDDVYMSDKIEKQVNALSELEDKTTLVYCDYVHIDKDSKLIGSMPETAFKKPKLLSWKHMLLDLFKSGSVNGCALLINKAVFDEVGMFDESLRFCQDGFMWYKIFMAKYALLSIPDVCVKGRIHGKQLTQTGQSLFYTECEKMSCIMIPQLIQASTEKYNFMKAYIKYNAKYGHTSIVKNALKEAKNTKLINFTNSVVIGLISVYGIIRPTIRKIYYTVCRGINTQ